MKAVSNRIYLILNELRSMKRVRDFYREYKPYIFSDGWYYIFIVVFIALLFLFFA